MELATLVRILGVVGLLVVTFLFEGKVMSSESDEWEKLVSMENPCVIKRTSLKNGFHRELKTTILLNAQPTDKDVRSVVLKERFPSGMYIDLFETKSHEQFGGPKVYTEKDMDIEKPEYLSSEQDIYIFEDLHRKGSHLYADIPLQVHLRYHKPSDDKDFDNVLLMPPTLYTKMPDTYQKIDGDGTESIKCDYTSDDMCQWRPVTCANIPGDGSINFSVPVGRTSDTGIVASATVIFTLGATLFLAKSILSKDTKQSKQN